MVKNKKVYFQGWLFFLLFIILIISMLYFCNVTGLIIANNWVFVPFLFFLSAFCEYIDSSIGMGYGTTLFPLLLLLGLSRQEIVPAILSAQLLAGVFCGLAHHKEGNVDLKNNKNIHKVLWILGLPSILGAIVASFMSLNISFSGQSWLNLYIGLMIIGIGIFLLYNCFFRKHQEPTKIKIPHLVGIGILAAFNKGVSGGGYGPLMMGGQLISGVRNKEAVVITNLCESFICLVALAAYLMMGGKYNLIYTTALCSGSLLAVVPSAKTLKMMSDNQLKSIIGWVTLLLGLMTIGKWITT